MPELNKDRIFSESPKKVLITEYTKMKDDYSKINAIKYFSLYENASLSFILENSRYIFSEPLKGYDFYKNIIESAAIPFGKLDTELDKVTTYYNENCSKMSDKQNSLYTTLIESVSNRIESMKNSSGLYSEMVENGSCNDKYYDALYEYMRNQSGDALTVVGELLESATPSDLMDIMNIVPHVNELSPFLYKYLKEDCFVENPTTANDYRLNSYSSNVLRRMMNDKAISESVDSLSNINARHIIRGLAGLTDENAIEEATVETVENFDPIYSTPINSINRMFEDDIYAEMREEQNTEEKLNRALNKKYIIESNLGFATMDYLAFGDELCNRNEVVEQICIESTTMTSIPNTYAEQIKILTEQLDEINNEIVSLTTEKYFSADGSAGKIVSASIGDLAADSKEELANRKSEHIPTSPKINIVDDDEDDDDDDDDEDDDKNEYQKKLAAKKRLEDRYSKMDIDNITLEYGESDDADDGNTKYMTVAKPDKKPLAQRIQNKALDANVKFKRKVANAKRTGTDVRNAGKAVAKIPENISTTMKKKIDEWDEADDDRRKEYMLKPGVRKKYFRLLKLAIMHGTAFSINPLLNIVLAMCQKLSAMKDTRIRNELTRELKAEINVVKAKIEDASGREDRQERYKLMRIQEKLEAELVRVGVNSKTL